jgi:rod shape-determining protein MreC
MTSSSPLRLTLVASLLFFAALGLSAYSRQQRSALYPLRALLSEVIAPAQRSVYLARNTTSSWWSSYVALQDVGQENKDLKNRLLSLESENSRLMEIARENERLRGLLHMPSLESQQVIAADVIGYDASEWTQSITLNRGTTDGISIGQAVVSGASAVGQIVSVSPSTAKVLLITDRLSSVDCVSQDSRSRGQFEGTGTRNGRVQFVRTSDAIAIGERLITSGLDTVFPRGLLLGTVTQVGNTPEGERAPISSALFSKVTASIDIVPEKLEAVLILISSS